MKCKVIIKLDNAAFTDNPEELSRLLSVCSSRVEDGYELGDCWQLIDMYGNVVGNIAITE